MLLRHEVQVRLRAPQVASAEQPTRADRDLRLGPVVVGSLRVVLGIEERGEPGDLIVLHQAELERPEDQHDGSERKHSQVPGPGPRHDQDPHEDGHEDDRRPQVGLEEDQEPGDGGDRGRSVQGLEGQVARPELGQECSKHGDQCQLGQLGGCELEPEQLEPPLGPADGRAERRSDQDQQGEARHVDDARVDLDEPVVEARGDQDDHDAERDEGQLLLQVEPRVDPLGHERRVGRGVDRDQAHHPQGEHGEKQDGVEVPERPAFRHVQLGRDDVHQSVTPPYVNCVFVRP